jgi:hypothetical protein
LTERSRIVGAWIPESARADIFRSLITLALFLALACAGNQKPAGDAGPESTEAEAPASGTAAPALTLLVPDSGRAGVDYPVRIVLQGSGFAVTGNIVTFGGIPSDPLDSTEEGSRITYMIPKEKPTAGEVPPEELLPGEYLVTVTTPGGTSEPLLFTLTGEA